MKHNIKLLNAVFLIQNPSHNRACNDYAISQIIKLAPRGCTVVRHRGNLLIRKGDSSGPHPYFLSHMDQVHDYEPFMTLHREGDILSALDGNGDQCGVGGDDKCGIYLALMMLHKLPHCTAVFVRDEEVGCCGSREVPLKWFDHAAFVIQADRNNRTMDIIRHTNSMICASDEFMEAMLALPTAVKHQHSEETGSITDIGELASRGLGCSMVNISSGYHNPHTSREVVNLSELSVTLQLAFEAARTMAHKRWDHEPQDAWRGSYGAYGNYGACGDFGQWPTKSTTEAYRDSLIDDLVLCGYDRHLSGLDTLPTTELEEMAAALDETLIEELNENLSY